MDALVYWNIHYFLGIDYRILSAALTNRSSEIIPLRAIKSKIAMTAGKEDAISNWKLAASGANCLLTTIIAIYHITIIKMFTIQSLACKGRRL